LAVRIPDNKVCRLYCEKADCKGIVVDAVIVRTAMQENPDAVIVETERNGDG
jgi:hypothetical protein